jgi:hypothetical protein
VIEVGATIMAMKKKTKAKAKAKAKASDLKPRKQVKGGVARKSDPCEGGEVSLRR